MEPDGLHMLLAHHSGGALSLVPFHAVQRPYEDLSLFFNINMTLGMVPSGLFGQMLLIERSAYQAAGGHAAVKDRVLENCFLAAKLRAAAQPTRSGTGRGILAFRMYPLGLGELISGWTKGFASGAGQTPRSVLVLVVAWMTGLIMAPVGWAMTGHWSWAVVYLASAVQVKWVAGRVGSFRWTTCLLYPLPLMFFYCLFAHSASRAGRQVTWKGRQFHAP
jgi:4,4'-diaponeurosporenoate glycosyltransferase